MNSGDHISVASISDTNYLPYLAALLQSIRASNHKRKISFTCISMGISPTEQKRLCSFFQDMGELKFIEWDFSANFKKYPLFHGSHAAYAKISLPDLLPELTRVIYLDADTIVQGDLLELWEKDLNGQIIGAEMEWGGRQPPAPETNHFNSGVLVYDLSAWRQNSISQQIVNWLQNHPSQIRNAEQDAMWEVFEGRWARLGPSWNVTGFFFSSAVLSTSISNRESCGVLSHPKIIHYMPSKPLTKESSHPLEYLFYSNFSKTPYGPRISFLTTLRLLLRKEFILLDGRFTRFALTRGLSHLVGNLRTLHKRVLHKP